MKLAMASGPLADAELQLAGQMGMTPIGVSLAQT